MNFFYTHISKKSYQLIEQVLNSTFLSEGQIVKNFETALAQKFGIVNPVTVNSGTSALHLGLATAGIGPKDEVIIPAQTFVATGLAVLMQKAKPVFADIQFETGNIDPKSIKQKITKKTKSIIPVHWGGYPCDLGEINTIAKEHNLVVLEDAAHALGAKYQGRPIGAISQFTAFSFQAVKHLTTGDGGALSCPNESDYEKAKNLRWFGIDRKNSKPSILGERDYDITQLGYKYHMNDLAAALGLGNLEDCTIILESRKKIASIYRKKLSNIAGLKLLSYSDDRESSYWLFTILVEKREDFIRKLQEHGIPSSVVHLRIDHNSVFGGLKNLPNQEKFNRMQVSIPIHQGLTFFDIELIIKTIKSGW